MNSAENTAQQIDLKAAAKDILATVEREREREIVARRFGLYDRKETLERIGDMLGITRERVRQLEKAVLTKLRASAESELPHIQTIDRLMIKHLHEMGSVSKVVDMTIKLFGEGSGEQEQAHVAFLASLAPGIAVVDENDNYHLAISIKEQQDAEQVRRSVDELVATIAKIGKPVTSDELHLQTKLEHPMNVHALATVSKSLAHLNGRWGLNKWPTVNPKNIRDKIYVVLSENTKPMHFSEIAQSIKNSSFRRRDVTTQAIHNELIKDKRFVLIGRGIYALSEWGYTEGTVADVISEILKSANTPMHRDDIVREVLKKRSVKETTILLNLQGKAQFKRTAKATYTLA